MRDRKFGDLSGLLGPLGGDLKKYLYHILIAETLETVLKPHRRNSKLLLFSYFAVYHFFNLFNARIYDMFYPLCSK